MAKNPILASFDQQPILISEGMESRFEAYLDQAFAVQAEVAQLNVTNPAKMSDAFWPEPDSWLADYRPYRVSGGILQIPVQGVLLSGFPYGTSWATGYEYIGKALDRGLADPAVQGIAFVIDSGGGDVRGNFDMVDRIHAARGQKPMRAFAAEHAYSAAYSIASAADSVTVARTGGVGSIGVVTMHIDVSAALANDGVKVTFIHFGKHKVEGNSYEPLSASAKARIQGRIDELGEVFVSTVARNRGMSEDAIRDTEALTFSAKEATSNGLADSIGSLEDAMSAFADDLSKEDDTMTKTNDMVANEQATQAALDAARAEGHAAGMTEGAAAEQARINAIIGSDEAKTRPIAAMNLAMKSNMDAATALTVMAGFVEETPLADKGSSASHFKDEMDKAEHPNLGAPAGDEGKPQLSRAERAIAMTGKKHRAA